jgi:hypothetical protein
VGSNVGAAGGELTEKLDGLEAVAAPIVMVIGPFVAPEGTVVAI